METQIIYTKSNNSAGGLSGDRWFIETYGDRMLINYLLVLLGKSLDSQTVYGNVHTDAIGFSVLIDAGTMDTRGLFWGESTGKQGVKVFGMENWWGNIFMFIVGLITSDGNDRYLYVKLTPNTADGSTGTYYRADSINGMINTGVTDDTNNNYTRWYKYNSLGYSVVYQNGQSGSNTTYYPDYGYTHGNSTGIRIACVGGGSTHKLNAGAFCFDVCDVGAKSSNRSASLSFR